VCQLPNFFTWMTRITRRCFFGYAKIPGDALSSGLAKSPQIIRQVGHFLAALHTIPLDSLEAAGMRLDGPQEWQTGAWRQDYLDFYARIQKYAFPEIERSASSRGESETRAPAGSSAGKPFWRMT